MTHQSSIRACDAPLSIGKNKIKRASKFLYEDAKREQYMNGLRSLKHEKTRAAAFNETHVR